MLLEGMLLKFKSISLGIDTFFAKEFWNCIMLLKPATKTLEMKREQCSRQGFPDILDQRTQILIPA